LQGKNRTNPWDGKISGEKHINEPERVLITAAKEGELLLLTSKNEAGGAS